MMNGYLGSKCDAFKMALSSCLGSAAVCMIAVLPVAADAQQTDLCRIATDTKTNTN
jgi:hypothetical protein